MGSEWPPEQVELYKRLAYSKLRSFAAATTQYTVSLVVQISSVMTVLTTEGPR
jgi:hypothetical protein